MTSCHRIRCLSWNPLLCIKPSVTTIFFAIVQRLKFLMQYFLKWYNQVQSYFWRYWHLLRDTGIITQLAVWATGIRHTRNRHPVAICYPLVCKERFVLVKSDCRYPLQLIHKCCGPNIGNVRYIQTEKFVIEVAYRETRPPFWDALISRGRHFRNPQNTYVSWRLLPHPSNSQDTSGTFGPQDQNLVIVGKHIC